MGQHALGLLYGCEAPKDLIDHNFSGEPIYDLLDRWEKANKSPGLRIRYKYEGEKDLLGVWVAVGGGGEDGAAYFLDEAILLEMVPTVFAKDIAKAKKLWDRFAKWVAKKENIDLPAATLWLTPCEVA